MHIGDPLDFTIQVTNNGPSVASDFEVTDTVPAGLEVTSVTGPVAGTAWTIDSITLVDPLDPLGGAIVVASYAGVLGVEVGVDDEADPLVISTLVHENALGTAANHVEITGWTEPDPEPGNDEWDDPLDVTPLVTLIIEKVADPASVFQVGKNARYLITVTNDGPHDDPGTVTVTDNLANGRLAFISSPDLPRADITVSQSGGVVEWRLPDGLLVGETLTLTIEVKVLATAYPSVTNSAVIDSPADKTLLSVLADSEVQAVKKADPLKVTGGDLAAGVLTAMALMLLLGGGIYVTGRGRRQARHS